MLPDAEKLQTLRIFTAECCPHCAALRRDFETRGLRFEEINLTENPERLPEFRNLVWERRLPVVVDHERISIGFRGNSSTFAQLGIDE